MIGLQRCQTYNLIALSREKLTNYMFVRSDTFNLIYH